MSLEGSRVLLVGGTSGIGLAVARLVAERGATPVVVSRSAQSVDAALAALPPGAEGDVADATDRAALDAVVARVGHIDHLVHTATAPLELLPLDQITDEVLDRFLGANIKGFLNAVAATAPVLPPTGSITVSSGTAGRRPGPAGFAVPALVTGAVESLVRALARELAPVRVNAVNPGMTRSPLWRGVPEEAREQMYQEVGAGLPAGRVGEVDDIALAFGYLMEQPYATGSVVTVDGGSLLV